MAKSLNEKLERLVELKKARLDEKDDEKASANRKREAY